MTELWPGNDLSRYSEATQKHLARRSLGYRAVLSVRLRLALIQKTCDCRNRSGTGQVRLVPLPQAASGLNMRPCHRLSTRDIESPCTSYSVQSAFFAAEGDC